MTNIGQKLWNTSNILKSKARKNNEENLYFFLDQEREILKRYVCTVQRLLRKRSVKDYNQLYVEGLDMGASL